MCGDGKESYRDPQQARTAKELYRAAKELEEKNKKKFSTGTDLQEDCFR
jgi:hypothetical protein